AGRRLPRDLLRGGTALRGQALLDRGTRRRARDARRFDARPPLQRFEDALEREPAIAHLRPMLGGDARDAARPMVDAHARFGLVLLLAAGTGRALGDDVALACEPRQRLGIVTPRHGSSEYGSRPRAPPPR